VATVPFDKALPHRVVIMSDLHAARDIEEIVIQQIQHFGYSEESAFAIRLSLEEALVNAHRHGNGSDPNKKIIISYQIDAKQAIIRICDEGVGFDPTSVPDPTSPERLCLPTGRGIMLMRSYLTEISYNPRGNEVQLVKEKS